MSRPYTLSALIGVALGLVARIWIGTLRVRSWTHPALCSCEHVPWVLALWHGQILPLLGFRRRRLTVALVSLSRDGERLAWAFRVVGVASERGSSSRSGVKGLARIIRRLARESVDAAVAVDGPRGPRHAVQRGALIAARRSGGVVVPFVATCERSVMLRTWDRFELPLPFSRVSVVLGRPVDPRAGCDVNQLANALDEACLQAQSVLRGAPRPALTAAPEENPG